MDTDGDGRWNVRLTDTDGDGLADGRQQPLTCSELTRCGLLCALKKAGRTLCRPRKQ